MRNKVNFIYYGLLILALIAFSQTLGGQSQKDLVKKRNNINSQINKANQDLRKTQSAKKSVQADLMSIQKKIDFSQQSIALLANYVDSINQTIDAKITTVEQLQKKLTLLHSNYKNIVRQLYQQQLQTQAVPFLWCQDPFNTSYQQLVYLQQLEKKTAKKTHYIKNKQITLAKYITILESQKEEKYTFLTQKLGEQNDLENKKNNKSQKISQLRRQENRLRADLERKKRYKLQLNLKIENIIKQQIASTKRAARKKSYTSKAKPPQKNKAKNSSSKNGFAAKKGALISPIYQGKIVGWFGKKQHPKFKDVYINNNGIDIQGQYNSVVRAVFEGEVISIFAIPGMNNAIMVKHGSYFTAYSNVSKIYIKKGQKVKQGAALGTIGKDHQTGNHILHFEIWKNKQKENPSLWIKR